MSSEYHPAPPHASEIAARLGLHRAGRGWRGDCPLCTYCASLTLDIGEGGHPLVWCASCGDSAGLARLLRSMGGLPERPEAPTPDRQPEAERLAERRERAQGLWNGAEPLTPDCPAGLYLARRKIEAVMTSPALRWRRDMPHPAGGRRLALLARIDGPDGKLQGVQRIFLKPDGTKADIEPQKATLGRMAGGAIRLQAASTKLTVAEGLESAAAAGAILGLPAWAAISAGNMARSLILPAEICSIIITADHDEPGLRAAEDAATRWRDEGRSVRVIRACRPGTDANDILVQAQP